MVLKRMVLVTMLLGICGCAADQKVLMDRWIWMGGNVPPATAEERLAAAVMANGRTAQRQGNVVASYVGEDRHYSVVEVKHLPRIEGEPTQVVKYRMVGTRISFATEPQYLQEINADHQQYALEAALMARAGTYPTRPPLVEGRYLFIPEYDGKCQVDVVEKDTDREVVATFRFNVCQ